MDLPTISLWARKKGIQIVGTGDFTHPSHFKAIKEELAPLGNGLFVLRGEEADDKAPRFMLTAEVSNIYKEDGKTRKIHNLIFAPSIDVAATINKEFAARGNVRSDGRPIFGFTSKELIKITLDASEDSMLIPAHAWTPWFSIFGSKSGYDTIEECFGDYSKYIFAIETGLSSDPKMNWRVSALDKVTLISNSDAHSPEKLGREANVFDIDSEPSYPEITRIIKERDCGKFLYTIEFYPEEGKYHHDGHRACKVLMTPAETTKVNGRCPVCNTPVTIGVLNRIDELSDRAPDFTPTDAIPTRSLVPLQEIIAAVMGRGVNTKGVQSRYEKIIEAGGNEFQVLLDLVGTELQEVAGAEIAHAIERVRRGNIEINPGYDGEFGTIIFTSKD
jgi:uncharacterized protein (TIGR00375 family)